jgi:hypothetical protein
MVVLAKNEENPIVRSLLGFLVWTNSCYSQMNDCRANTTQNVVTSLAAARKEVPPS